MTGACVADDARLESPFTPPPDGIDVDFEMLMPLDVGARVAPCGMISQ